jgi:hypothetical protein
MSRTEMTQLMEFIELLTSIQKTMTHTFLFLSIILLTLSCSNSKTNNSNETKIVSDTIYETKSNLRLDNEASNNMSDKDFQQFWLTFRQAVISNDTNKIIAMTILPFETRGEMDSDPIVKYCRNNFFKAFRAYLGQSTYWKSDESFISSFEEIKRITNPDSTYIQGDWARVGNLEFKNKDGHWRLAFAYLNIRDEDLWKR